MMTKRSVSRGARPRRRNPREAVPDEESRQRHSLITLYYKQRARMLAYVRVSPARGDTCALSAKQHGEHVENVLDDDHVFLSVMSLLERLK